uniref:Uncharacterized protein n=1 Tax=Anopheles minimus TaxID=112268 RepID=A0A182VTP1_9DIPT
MTTRIILLIVRFRMPVSMEVPQEDANSTSCPMESYPTPAQKAILGRFCRLCMREYPFLLPFDAMYNDVMLGNMLERLLGAFKLEQTSTLPDGVCPHCVTKLDYAYHVQKEFVCNEHRLRHYHSEGTLLTKLLEYQTKFTVSKDTYTDRMVAEHGTGLLAERIEVDPMCDAPNISEAKATAASMYKTVQPPREWTVVACDCEPARSQRTKPTLRPLKGTPRNRHNLRQAIDAVNPNDEITPIDPCKCYVCDTVLKTEQAYRDHLVDHVDMLPHRCPTCSRDGETDDSENNTLITSLAMLQRHYRMHSYPLKCPHCPQRFRKHAAVYSHIRYRHELFDNPEGYTCDICGVTMQYRPSFRYHMRIHYHEQMGTFKCQYCERVFGTRARLECHERTHTGERPFACHVCPKTFIHSGQLATHIARHNNERGHKCTQCGKAFFTKAMLRQHSESHETEGTRKVSTTVKPRHRPCLHPGCTHVARTYQAYYLHRLRHEMAHRCEECGRRFARFCELRRHRHIYHSSVHPFKCDLCNKPFLSSQSYREHMDSHANVRRFECDVCDKKFVRRRNLVNHRMSHTNVRPYRCEDCDSATFKYKSDLNRHRKEKHGQAEQDAPIRGDGGAASEQIVLLNEDPVMDGMLVESVSEGILVNEGIELDGTTVYGEVIETVEESIIVEQPIVSFVMSEEFCRICLLKSTKVKPLMERVDGVMIPEMLYKLCGRQIEVQEGYPRSICQRCVCHLDCAFRFLNEFHQQDERLRSFYWSGSVAERLQEYQSEGKEKIHRRMEELTSRHKALFKQPAKVMSNKETNTVRSKPPKTHDVGTSMDKELINLQLVKTEDNSDDDMLLEHYVMEEDNEETYLDYCVDSETTAKDQQLVAMKIDVLESADEAESYSDEKPPSTKASKSTRQQPMRSKKTRVKIASSDTQDESIPTDTDDQAHEQVYYEETGSEEEEEEEEEEEMFDDLQCYICDMKEENEELLQQHLDLHNTMLPYDCKSCLDDGVIVRTIKTVSSLHNHFRSHHYPYWCEICGKRFLRKMQLRKHKENHSNSLFMCDECGRGFTHKKTWQNHIKRHKALRAEMYKCNTCGKAFGNKARLDRHMRLHTGDRPFECKYCDKRYYDRHQLQCHTERHFREIDCTCEFCGDTFTGIKKLDAHKIAKHLTGKELEDFLASRAKRVKRQAILKDETCPYPECNYTAKTYGAMYAHMLTHTSERKFSCEICGNCYKTNGELKKHNKNKHELDILEQDVVIETDDQYIVEYV